MFNKEQVIYFVKKSIKVSVFFVLGIVITSTLLVIILYFLFEESFKGQVYPGVYIGGRNFGGQTKAEIYNLFSSFNDNLSQVTIEIPVNTATDSAFTVSERAGNLGIFIDANKITETAYKIGRSEDFLQNLEAKGEAVSKGIYLQPEINIDTLALNKFISTIKDRIEIEPQEALFSFSNGRVNVFKLSQNGRKIDTDQFEKSLKEELIKLVLSSYGAATTTKISVPLPVMTIVPRVTTEGANNLGIKELLGSGVSYFYDSITERVYNLTLATSRVNGLLVKPGEEFSFDQEIGTISAQTGYKKAYSIVQGKTVLDDGGGVCQVSTTLYRAVLNAGLPVTERVAHAYRVGFYEQGGFSPGIDATVYPPSPDFRFKNDTGNWILIQAYIDNKAQSLTFDLYGTSDGRVTEVSKPVILSQTPPPEPVYQDDPTIARGIVKQVDTAHFGAKVFFTRKVIRGGEVLIDERVESNYRPWAAVYLRGIKE